MGYKMAIDSKVYNVGGSYFTEEFTESKYTITNPGLSMHLTDISGPDIHLTWGGHIATRPNALSIAFETPAVVSHFCLENCPCKGYTPTTSGKLHKERNFRIYNQEARVYEHPITLSNGESRYSFFELAVSEQFLDRFFPSDKELLQNFRTALQENDRTGNRLRDITPAMQLHISDMVNNPYEGHFKGLYLEAKAVELFLLQIESFLQKKQGKPYKLKPHDIECLYKIKEFMDQNYTTSYSIIELAKVAGINQMKLKNGFRELFGTTVFGYLRNLKMEKARQLLLEEKLYVAEVAEKVGYRHPHHFAAAFQKKFGILPSELKG